MSLSLTQICLKEKKTKTESEYENSAFDDNVANVNLNKRIIMKN